jgi:hypothetical protein
MEDAQLEGLLTLKGPGYPPVAKALQDLPDGHPLKPIPVDVEVGIPMGDAIAEQATRLDNLEARVAALEALA